MLNNTIVDKPADTQTPIHPLLTSRWSPRTFSDESISTNHLNQLFEAIRWAPSSMNEQPWRILYVRKGTDEYDKVVSILSDFNQSWVTNAPVILLAAYKKKFDSGKDNFHALHDLGLGMAMLTVQAQHLNIAVHQMAGVDWQEAHKVFNVPDEFHVATAVALGYYGGELDDLSDDLQKQETKERQRKPSEEIVAEGQFPFNK